MSFRPISALYEKIYPWNINYMPAVNFLVCLDLERKSYEINRLIYQSYVCFLEIPDIFFDGHR
jgi:hypothetical protein